MIGGHREWYRSLEGKGSKVTKTNYYPGLPVESEGELSNGKTFADFEEFRELLLEDPDTITRAIAEKLLIYGSGRQVTSRERSSIDSIVKAAEKNNYGLRSMIHAVVESELFLSP